MRKKVCLFLMILIIISIFISVTNTSYAGEIVGKLNMGKVNQIDSTANGTGLLNAINGVIGLMQLVGSGVALIIITILGIKYILASPSDKADVKKSIMPILIGCLLLFGGVNIAAAIASFGESLNGSGAEVPVPDV